MAVTKTSDSPPPHGGNVAVQTVVLMHFTLVAGLSPKVSNVKVVPPGLMLKLAPVMVTVVPPAVGPLDGEMLLMAGKSAYVKTSKEVRALLRPSTVTMRSTGPVELDGGLTASHQVGVEGAE